MKRATIILLLTLSLTGCDRGAFVDVASCAYRHEKLGVVFKRPAVAKRYLQNLAERIRSRDPESYVEAAELVAALEGCIP